MALSIPLFSNFSSSQTFCILDSDDSAGRNGNYSAGLPTSHTCSYISGATTQDNFFTSFPRKAAKSENCFMLTKDAQRLRERWWRVWMN